MDAFALDTFHEVLKLPDVIDPEIYDRLASFDVHHDVLECWIVVICFNPGVYNLGISIRRFISVVLMTGDQRRGSSLQNGTL